MNIYILLLKLLRNSSKLSSGPVFVLSCSVQKQCRDLQIWRNIRRCVHHQTWWSACLWRVLRPNIRLWGGGQCSRRDWTVLLIFSLTGAITKLVSVMCVVNFGSDWTKFTAWPQIITACCLWTWKTLKGILLMPSITCLVLWIRLTSTSWTSANTQVIRFVSIR